MEEEGRFRASSRQISGRHPEVVFRDVSAKDGEIRKRPGGLCREFGNLRSRALSKSRLDEQQKTLAVSRQPPQQSARNETGKASDKNCVVVQGCQLSITPSL
jgi:hypothetical protein